MENNIKHGSDDTVRSLLGRARETGVPVAHSCLRKELGLAMYGKRSAKVPRTACFGIVNPHGLGFEFKDLLRILQEKKTQWNSLRGKSKRLVQLPPALNSC